MKIRYLFPVLIAGAGFICFTNAQADAPKEVPLNAVSFVQEGLVVEGGMVQDKGMMEMPQLPAEDQTRIDRFMMFLSNKMTNGTPSQLGKLIKDIETKKQTARGDTALFYNELIRRITQDYMRMLQNIDIDTSDSMLEDLKGMVERMGGAVTKDEAVQALQAVIDQKIRDSYNKKGMKSALKQALTSYQKKLTTSDAILADAIITVLNTLEKAETQPQKLGEITSIIQGVGEANERIFSTIIPLLNDSYTKENATVSIKDKIVDVKDIGADIYTETAFRNLNMATLISSLATGGDTKNYALLRVDVTTKNTSAQTRTVTFPSIIVKDSQGKVHQGYYYTDMMTFAEPTESITKSMYFILDKNVTSYKIYATETNQYYYGPVQDDTIYVKTSTVK